MADTTNIIKCPHCGKSFEPNEAFRHQMQEEIVSKEKSKHETELKALKEETEKR